MGYRTKEKELSKVLPGIWRTLRALSPQIRKQGWLIAGSLLALLAETGFRLLEPWPLKFLFDGILAVSTSGSSWSRQWIEGIDPSMLLAGSASLIVAIACLRGVAGYLSKLGMALATVRVLAEVRGNLYSHLQRLSLSFHHRSQSGDLITRILSDVDRLRNAVISTVVPLLTNTTALVGALSVAFWIDWELAAIALGLFLAFATLVRQMLSRIREAARRYRKSEGALASTASETLGAIEVVQALALQSSLESIFSRQNQENLQQGTESLQLSALLNRSTQILISVAIALVVWRGSSAVLEGRMTPGELVVFLNYLKDMFDPPMRKLSTQMGDLAKAAASGERVVELLQQEPSVRDLPGAYAAPPFIGQIQFQGVSFGYEPEQLVLDDISFEVAPGQTVAIVGPSGSGKSTLASLLLRLYEPTSGYIAIDGHDLREYTLESLRQQIATVLQGSVLFATTVWENIALGKSPQRDLAGHTLGDRDVSGASDREVREAARLANADGFITDLPKGYDTVLGERGAMLSGGQRQRIAIARAAIRQAPILVLDEPMTGLDNASERIVTEAIARLSRGCTTVLITHDLHAAESADLILYMERGRILERGTHSSLMCLGGGYAALYRLQSSEGSRADTYAFMS